MHHIFQISYSTISIVHFVVFSKGHKRRKISPRTPPIDIQQRADADRNPKVNGKMINHGIALLLPYYYGNSNYHENRSLKTNCKIYNTGTDALKAIFGRKRREGKLSRRDFCAGTKSDG